MRKNNIIILCDNIGQVLTQVEKLLKTTDCKNIKIYFDYKTYKFVVKGIGIEFEW